MNDKEIDYILSRSEALIEQAFALRDKADAIRRAIGFSVEHYDEELAQALPPHVLAAAMAFERTQVEEAKANAEALIAAQAPKPSSSQPAPAPPRMKRILRYAKV
ncbi:hypothetical protein FP568_04480 [Pandoraea pnomenusa]|uniref:hypothetical protein n=1 Tax=Pandoraea pnomenusa TaxID=93220 RepID=UPI0011989224|nr:hypothetical protein [Pandoraea pnomenusa]QDX20585.1 hypothetical protein FP568_04480 [Pandoraea pnomenusa]